MSPPGACIHNFGQADPADYVYDSPGGAGSTYVNWRMSLDPTSTWTHYGTDNRYGNNDSANYPITAYDLKFWYETPTGSTRRYGKVSVHATSERMSTSITTIYASNWNQAAAVGDNTTSDTESVELWAAGQKTSITLHATTGAAFKRYIDDLDNEYQWFIVTEDVSGNVDALYTNGIAPDQGGLETLLNGPSEYPVSQISGIYHSWIGKP